MPSLRKMSVIEHHEVLPDSPCLLNEKFKAQPDFPHTCANSDAALCRCTPMTEELLKAKDSTTSSQILRSWCECCLVKTEYDMCWLLSGIRWFHFLNRFIALQAEQSVSLNAVACHMHVVQLLLSCHDEQNDAVRFNLILKCSDDFTLTHFYVSGARCH